MKITISTNKKLDIGIIEDFYNDGSLLIRKNWPRIQNQEDISSVVENEYGPKLQSKVMKLRAENRLLDDIACAASEVTGEAWNPIESVSIFIGACPIALRFLDIHWVLLPYYYDIATLINLSAHEMIHFLYFKKWSALFPDTKVESYESPNPEWVLSEILVAIIGNDKRIRELVGSESDIYPNWREIKFGDKGLVKIFSKIYEESASFDDFLKLSWNKYQELEKKYKITDKLAGNPF
jgi:hypothetical protein